MNGVASCRRARAASPRTTGAGRESATAAPRPLCTGGRGQGREVDPGQRERRRTGDHLHRPAVAEREGRAERLVPCHDRGQGRGEGGGGETPGEGERRRNAVGGAFGVELGEEPEPFLG